MNGTLARGLRLVTHALQILLLVLTGYALVGWEIGPLVNVGLPFLIALFPAYVRYRYDDPFDPVLALWIVVAATLHATGSLGLYDAVPFYDQIAHGVSGSMVAGVGYAIVRTVEIHHDDVVVPDNLRFVFILVFTVAFGVVWEVAEFSLGLVAALMGGEPLLAQHGLQDTVLDLVFDIAGGVVVGVWGTTYFDDLRAFVGPYVEDAEPE